MFRMKAPLRLVIASLLADGTPRSAEEIATALRPAYPGERQINARNLDAQAQALRAVGIVAVAAERIDDRGGLVQSYTLTDYGREKMRKAL